MGMWTLVNDGWKGYPFLPNLSIQTVQIACSRKVQNIPEHGLHQKFEKCYPLDWGRILSLQGPLACHCDHEAAYMQIKLFDIDIQNSRNHFMFMLLYSHKLRRYFIWYISELQLTIVHFAWVNIQTGKHRCPNSMWNLFPTCMHPLQPMRTYTDVYAYLCSDFWSRKIDISTVLEVFSGPKEITDSSVARLVAIREELRICKSFQ